MLAPERTALEYKDNRARLQLRAWVHTNRVVPLTTADGNNPQMNVDDSTEALDAYFAAMCPEIKKSQSWIRSIFVTLPFGNN